MSAPDFYFGISAMFKHIHDRFGRDALVKYWHDMGTDYYRQRWQQWRDRGLPAIAQDWRSYFDKEPGSGVHITTHDDHVTLDIRTCPAIAHLRKHHRDVPNYFCQHCDVMNSAMATPAGFRFERQGGMGSCVQKFVQVGVTASSSSDSSNSPSKAG